MSVTVEICLFDGESAIAAQEGGAHRIELCQDRGVGGTTPSYGTIAKVREHLSIAIHVMIRPRGGDYCYSDFEVDMMVQDIKAAKLLGADGVVIGVLNPDGTVNKKVSQILVDIARPMKITFNRAIDMSRNPFEALETLISLGIDHVLTSGQAPSAIDGLETICALNKMAGNEISIMAGAGINHKNVQQIIQSAGLKEVHIGSAAEEKIEGRMQYKNQRISMASGAVEPEEYMYPLVSVKKVRTFVEAANR